ncbi:acyl carrier protein [Proteinivorax hydrogeniformans]|uniref:Acyl carrier protein n=1 Tax=Proteinivorax hydrogeniformans TaxID=1826727 RepID=A0AAU8HVL5_9FIRM
MAFEKIKGIIEEQLDIEEEITKETSFEDMGVDSLDIFQLVVELEEAFEIEIDDSEAASMKTVGDAVEFVEKKTAK